MYSGAAVEEELKEEKEISQVGYHATKTTVNLTLQAA
jgi:hypothetical protein